MLTHLEPGYGAVLKMVELKRRLWYKLHDGGNGYYSMMSLDLFLSPNLKTSGMKVSHLLQKMGGGYEPLLLNLPREMEESVMELASEDISCDELVDEACRSRLVPEPVGSWEYAMKPVLEALPQLSRRFPNLRMYCYGSSEHEFASMGVAVRFARLTLKTALTGDVEVGEWWDALRRSLDVDGDAIEAEAGAIVERIEGSSICLSGLGGRVLKRPLTRAGLDVKTLYVEKPYHFTPLTILKRKMVGGDVGDEEIEKLVKFHMEYVRSYIYREIRQSRQGIL